MRGYLYEQKEFLCRDINVGRCPFDQFVYDIKKRTNNVVVTG